MIAVGAGDRDALRTVYDMTSDKVFATLIGIVRSRDRAEDLLQDVFLKVWKGAGRFDPAKGSAIAWLCTIARNHALNDIRRDGRDPSATVADLPEVADDRLRPSDDWLCDTEEAEALMRCLDQLQAEHSRSIKLAFFEGLTHSQLAEKVDVPLGTMKSWIRRGLAGLKGCLGG